MRQSCGNSPGCRQRVWLSVVDVRCARCAGACCISLPGRQCCCTPLTKAPPAHRQRSPLIHTTHTRTPTSTSASAGAAAAAAAAAAADALRPAAQALSSVLLAASLFAGAAAPALAEEPAAAPAGKAPTDTVYFGNGCFCEFLFGSSLVSLAAVVRRSRFSSRLVEQVARDTPMTHSRLIVTKRIPSKISQGAARRTLSTRSRRWGAPRLPTSARWWGTPAASRWGGVGGGWMGVAAGLVIDRACLTVSFVTIRTRLHKETWTTCAHDTNTYAETHATCHTSPAPAARSATTTPTRAPSTRSWATPRWCRWR